jgi:hypothetical protein
MAVLQSSAMVLRTGLACSAAGRRIGRPHENEGLLVLQRDWLANTAIKQGKTLEGM